MENLGMFYDHHLVYFTAIGNILWPVGIFCGHLVHFPHFGILYQGKSGNPPPIFLLSVALLYLKIPWSNAFIICTYVFKNYVVLGQNGFFKHCGQELLDLPSSTKMVEI
jgi:hypothetical protein